MKPIDVGLLGIGTVGGGTWEVLNRNADEIQRRALDPFFTTRRNEGGTGLGLHIIFNLVTQQLGGRLTFESKLGWGTRFRITIPRIAPGESPSLQAAQ